MKRKIIWVVVSGLMVLALLATSCAKAEEEVVPVEKEAAPVVKEAAPVVKEAAPAEAENMVKVTLTKADGTIMEKQLQLPRYGGSFTYALQTDVEGFDPTITVQYRAYTAHWTLSKLIGGDWSKGGSGTGDASFLPTIDYSPSLFAPELASSWEFPDDQTVIYHLRKGVHFQNIPPVNGREMTADDVVFSIKRHWELPTSHLFVNYPADQRPLSVTALDKYTVEVKASPVLGAVETAHLTEGFVFVYPPEVIKKYGDIKDWRNVIGTGPFILEDRVPMSSTTAKRNPDFFLKDPLYISAMEFQLPYIDKLRLLVIPDKSTLLAAFRTYKLDYIAGLTRDQYLDILRSRLDIGATMRQGGPNFLGMRLDKPDLPWAPQFDENALKVRRALNMAINRQELSDALYGGYADILSLPIIPMPEFMDVYIPLEQQSASVQEYFTYNPAKAMELLKEAGYPQGFKAKVDVQSTPATAVELMSAVKAYWAEIGVELTITPREQAVWMAIALGRTHEQMLYRFSAATGPLRMQEVGAIRPHNASMVNDPFLEGMALKMGQMAGDDVGRRALYKAEVLPYILEQAYWFQPPAPYTYTLWHQWVRNYAGEANIGSGHYFSVHWYIWIDRELKRAITGRN